MARQRFDQTVPAQDFRAVFRALALAALLLVPVAAPADDEAALRTLLDEFLSRVDDAAMHDRFWDDTLIYTSSSGARFGKTEILEGMAQSAAGGEAPSVRYWAEDVRVMVFGETAVVAFRLMSETGEGNTAEQASYYNTGTFRSRDDGWRAVAWQATRIPEDG